MITVPKYIYKYHQMNLHLMEMLTNAEFYMSMKSNLNDPLDMAYTIKLENYLNMYYEKYPSLKNDPKHVENASFLFKWQIEKGENDLINNIDESYSKLRVVCFTEDGSNPLMWSHYALNHTGVCLKFDPSIDSNLEKALCQVEYSDKLIEVKNDSDLKKCLLTKLKIWSIEKEWRIISDKDKFPFKQEALVEIIFGLRVSESTMSWFKQFIENVYYMHTQIHKLKIINGRLVMLDEYDEVISSTYG